MVGRTIDLPRWCASTIWPDNTVFQDDVPVATIDTNKEVAR